MLFIKESAKGTSRIGERYVTEKADFELFKDT